MNQQILYFIAIILSSITSLICVHTYYVRENRTALKWSRIFFTICIISQLFSLHSDSYRLDTNYLRTFTLLFSIITLIIDYVAKSSVILYFTNPAIVINFLFSLLLKEDLQSHHVTTEVLIHIILFLTVYLTLQFSFLLAIFHQIQDHSLKSKSSSFLAKHTPPLVYTRNLMIRTTYVGLLLLTGSILFSYLQARSHLKIDNWRWDPKLWILTASWLIYALAVTLASAKKIKYGTLSLLIILGFITLFISQFTSLIGDFHSKL